MPAGCGSILASNQSSLTGQWSYLKFVHVCLERTYVPLAERLGEVTFGEVTLGYWFLAGLSRPNH